MTGNSTTTTTTANGSSNLEIAQSNQDLIMTKGKRKKRTWIMAGVATLITISLLIAAIVLLVNKEEDKKENVPEAAALELDDVLFGKLNPKSFNASWSSGKELIYSDAVGNLVQLDLSDKSTRILVPSDDEILNTAFDYKVSADKKYLLIAYNYQKLYRHSYRANYKIIELGSSKTKNLSVGSDLDIQLVIWAPVGNAMAFVYRNNVFYKKSVDDDEIVTVTSDTQFVQNGVPDWVYEEEVFSSNKALWFSPDGKKLAYGKFNDTETPVMVVPIYGEPGSLIFQYPRANFVKYPKAGTKNPTVSLHVVDLANTTLVKQMEPPSDLAQMQPILSAVTWATNDVVAAIWMNRVQNQASIVTYKTSEPYTTEIVKSLKETAGWLELFTAPKFAKDGSKLILILPVDQGNDLGAYRHIVSLEREQNSVATALTEGAFVVTEILGWNEDNKVIYYTANTANDSSIQHVYSISTENKEVKCISCGRKSKNNEDCLYNTAEFSTDFSYYVFTCAGPDVPLISVYNKDNVKLLDWDENESLIELIKNKKTPVIKKMSFDVANGFRAQVSLKLPPNLDTSGNTKYPMLVNVYGGPDSYQVVDKFSLDWGSYLAANKSIIYATIDGRGSGLKGNKILFSGYRKLGTVEIIDQINVTRLIQESLPYVDATRTAIWGWSYGGYASGMALATDKDGVFKCGISVAPVTDWALYDSIYTERFMGLPTVEDNLKGYQEAQLLTKYEGLRDKMYFLIHGTYDDNVHYQQSMLWSKVLEQRDILFRQQSYPDEDHGLGSVRPHLYHSLENFLDECFIEKE